MDGDSQEDVPERKIRKLTKRQRDDPLRGKKFYDGGDNEPKSQFKKGEFTVIARQPSDSGNAYWCEREMFGSNLSEKRVVELFDTAHMMSLIQNYEDE